MIVLKPSHPAVREILQDPRVSDFWREPGGYRDLPESLVCLLDSSGLFVVERFEHGGLRYAGIHAALIERGKNAVRSGRQAIEHCFTYFQADKVVARVQRDRRDVQMYTALCGMTRYGADNTHVYYEALPCR